MVISGGSTEPQLDDVPVDLSADHKDLVMEYSGNKLCCIIKLLICKKGKSVLKLMASNAGALQHKISTHILHTVLYTFLKVLTRRICFNNQDPL